MLRLVLLLAFMAQDSTSIHEAKYRFEKHLKKIDGVMDVSVGGIDGKLSLVVMVETAGAKSTVLALTGGKADGYPIRVIVSSSREVGKTGKDAEPKKRSGPGKTVAEPYLRPKDRPGGTRSELDKLDDPNHVAEQCDIVREKLGLKPRYKNNRQPHCVLVRRTVVGVPRIIRKARGQKSRGVADITGGLKGVPQPVDATPWAPSMGILGTSWSCWYPRHRKDCPIARKRWVDWIMHGDSSKVTGFRPVRTTLDPPEGERPNLPARGGGKSG